MAWLGSRLREENHRQSALIEEVERVRKLTLHDEGSEQHDVSVGKKCKEIKTVKRVPISKNTYSSKVNMRIIIMLNVDEKKKKMYFKLNTLRVLYRK